MDHQQVVVGHSCHILFLDGLVPDLHLGRVTGVQLTRLKALRDHRLLHVGVDLTEDISLALFAVIVLHGALLNALTDGAPDRSAIGPGIQIQDQELPIHDLSSRCVKRHISHLFSPLNFLMNRTDSCTT